MWWLSAYNFLVVNLQRLVLQLIFFFFLLLFFLSRLLTFLPRFSKSCTLSIRCVIDSCAGVLHGLQCMWQLLSALLSSIVWMKACWLLGFLPLTKYSYFHSKSARYFTWLVMACSNGPGRLWAHCVQDSVICRPGRSGAFGFWQGVWG